MSTIFFGSSNQNELETAPFSPLSFTDAYFQRRLEMAGI